MHVTIDQGDIQVEVAWTGERFDESFFLTVDVLRAAARYMHFARGLTLPRLEQQYGDLATFRQSLEAEGMNMVLISMVESLLRSLDYYVQLRRAEEADDDA